MFGEMMMMMMMMIYESILDFAQLEMARTQSQVEPNHADTRLRSKPKCLGVSRSSGELAQSSCGESDSYVQKDEDL